ncbi:hypothetical protein D020_3855A, partial [Vibrio parahaemolyticus SBR10290]
MWCASEL